MNQDGSSHHKNESAGATPMLDAAHRLAAALTALRPEHAQSMKIHPLTNDGRSWLLHCERYWPLGDGDLTATWSARPMELTTGMIFGKKVEFPRRTAAFGVDYKYTGQTQQARPMEAAPTSVRDVIAAMQQVDTLTEHNAALVNWYDAKLNEYMGAHSDDERELVPLAPVVSLSWCTPGHFRRFRLTAKKGVTDALLPSFGAAPGVIRVMKTTKTLGEDEGRRINLTLRAFGAASANASRKRQRAEQQTDRHDASSDA